MVNIDRFSGILGELLDELPEPVFIGLNGGVRLSEKCLESPYSKRGDLFILGQYNRSDQMGSSIEIFYGSFLKLFGSLPEDLLRKEIRKVLRHEFRHHIEIMAGDHSLADEDHAYIAEYLNREK